MKFAALVLLACLGAANADLTADIETLLKDHVFSVTNRNIISDCIQNDAEVQALVTWSASPECATMVEDIRSSKECSEFITYFQGLCPNCSTIEIPAIIGPNSTMGQDLRNYNDRFLTSIQQRTISSCTNRLMVSGPSILAKIRELQLTSPPFRTYWAQMQSKESQNVFNNLYVSAQAQILVKKLKALNVPVEYILFFIKFGLSWTQ